jgi:hypothetical protein
LKRVFCYLKRVFRYLKKAFCYLKKALSQNKVHRRPTSSFFL